MFDVKLTVFDRQRLAEIADRFGENPKRKLMVSEKIFLDRLDDVFSNGVLTHREPRKSVRRKQTPYEKRRAGYLRKKERLKKDSKP